MALFNTAQRLFLIFPMFFKKQWAFCQCTSCIFTNNQKDTHARMHASTHTRTHTHTHKYMQCKSVHAHIQTQIQIHGGVSKSFRSGRPDTETQETIGCQKGPWACLTHISQLCAIACGTVVASAVLQSTETTPYLVPPLPLLTRKWAGIILSQDGHVAIDRERCHQFI